jgi:hypothetical protein
MSVPLLALTARGIVTAGANYPTSSPNNPENRVLVGVAALCLSMLAAFLPWRSLDKYYHYLNMQPVLSSISKDRTFGRSLVVIRGPEYPDYASAANENPLDLQADAPIFARDTTVAARQALMQTYSDRPIWVVDGPTRSGGSYRVVAGPLKASDVIAGRWPP